MSADGHTKGSINRAELVALLQGSLSVQHDRKQLTALAPVDSQGKRLRVEPWGGTTRVLFCLKIAITLSTYCPTPGLRRHTENITEAIVAGRPDLDHITQTNAT